MPAPAETNSSELRTRCELQRRSESITATGEVQIQWQVYCIFWAKEIVQTPRQFVAAQEILAEARRVFRTYYVAGVRLGDRVVVVPDGRTYDVIGTSDPDGRRMWIDIYCVEQQHAN